MPPPRSQSLRARSLTIFHYRHWLDWLSAPIGRFFAPFGLFTNLAGIPTMASPPNLLSIIFLGHKIDDSTPNNAD